MFRFATLSLICGLSLPVVGAERPNVLLICVDDLKPVLGCYGNKIVQSPHLDRLAEQSVRFDRAYCNQAVCAPSRNALLTGVRPSTMGIYDLGTNFRAALPNAVTLPQHFKNHGYQTQAIGKIFHVGHGNHEDKASWSVAHMQMNSIAYMLPESRAKEGLTREEALFSNQPAGRLPRGAPVEAADVPDDAYPDGKIAAEAIKRLQAFKAKPAAPLFLAVGFLKPHLPFCAPKKYWDLYDRNKLPLAERRTPPEGAPKYAPQFGGELRQYQGVPEQGPVSEEMERELVHGYYAATSYVDAQIGRVLDELARLELAESTIVIVWGDHGWHLGDHGMWCKHTNYEQAARIPLLVRAPGRKPGVANGLVESVDIYPTLCALAGIENPRAEVKLDGQSFAAALRDPAANTKDHILHVYPRGERLGRAVRTERYRLVEWKKPGAPPEAAELELYDYEADPLETKNVASEQTEVVRELRAMLARHPEAKPQVSAAPKPVDRAALFKRKDANGDGKLTRTEFLANQPDPDKAPARFVTFDKNKDGELSEEEFVGMGK